ncbi:MAG: LptF/LptG family permease, partial [Cyanobacteria bacterium]|nr:LptF/LptG family permease [Cyanobacteriota bacterium]
EWVTPVTAPKLEALYQGYGLKQKKDDNFVYVEKNQLGQLDKFILIGQTPKNHLKDFLFLYYHPTTEGGVQISRILRAPEGRWSPQEKAWQLFNGIDYELDSEGVYHDIRRFSEQWVSTSKYPAKLLEFSKINPLSMKLGTIKEYIDLLKEGGQFQEVRFSEVSFFQKILFPLGTLLFALIGAVLGTEKVRTNGNLGIIYGAVVLFLYSILIPFSTNVGSIGIIPPLLAAILPLSACLAGFWLIATFKRVQT